MPRFRTWLRQGLCALVLSQFGTALFAPPLTTIADVLYKANGTRFNGVAFIEWKSFQASDFSQIATHSVTVPIVDGNLRVQLVPTTTASAGARYTVRYNSDGRIQFVETWAVPPSNVALKLKDVRVTAAAAGLIDPPVNTQIQIADVTGLDAELAARPVKGIGHAANRSVRTNANGQLEAVAGNLTDCVRVDGTSSACGAGGSGSPSFVDGETPAGLINGSNVTFTVGNAPSPAGSLEIHRNGILQKQGADYTLSGLTVTFVTMSTPQTGDTLLAAYRLADPGNPTGAAGGHLTGTFPNPQIALGVISNANLSAVAGVVESKLALNYPTHSSASDPTSAEKSALAGTAGTPGGSNRFVTDQDTRLTNSRAPTGHPLLDTAHSDTTVGTVTRGDMIVGQGASPTTWARLPIGATNRCLMSNGFDAVWNTCLYTGFTAGAIPFVDSIGNLSQNSARLFWDNNNRRLSVANNLMLATMYVYDSAAAVGSTTLVVRAGQAQTTFPLQQWLDTGGAELGRMGSDGIFTGVAFSGATSASRAAWRDTGAASDPSTRVDGDVWHNTTGLSRKTQESGQVHTLPQVLCSSVGISTSSTSLTRLGSCTVPASFLKTGDRVEIQFSYSHEGTATAFTSEVRWGATTLLSRAAASTEPRVVGRSSSGVYSGGALWDSQSWGTTLTFAATAGNAADSLASSLVIDLLAQMASSTSDTVTLRNFTVVRYPAQANP